MKFWKIYEQSTGWPDKHGSVFLVPLKSNLSSVQLYSSVNWTSNILQGARKSRPCLTGHAVFKIWRCPSTTCPASASPDTNPSRPTLGTWSKLQSCYYRVVCPNFGHPVLTSSFTKYRFLQVKNSLAKIVNGLSVLRLFQFRMVIYCFLSMTTASTKCVNLKWRS